MAEIIATMASDAVNEQICVIISYAALESAIDTHKVNHTLGWALVKNGQAKQGLPYLRQAQVLQANNALAAFHLGVALSQLNRPIEAIQALENALQIVPNLQQRDEAKALLIRLATHEAI